MNSSQSQRRAFSLLLDQSRFYSMRVSLCSHALNMPQTAPEIRTRLVNTLAIARAERKALWRKFAEGDYEEPARPD